MHKNIKPANYIFGIEGYQLTELEKSFFKEAQPWGFILFARNCKDKEQIKSLIDELYEVLDRDHIPILIDQEGGRVARLKPPHFSSYQPAKYFGDLAVQDLNRAKEELYESNFALSKELAELGINVNCAPVADLFFENANKVIGDRSFGSNPELVIELAKVACQASLDAGVTPVIKHIPGHGRANADSHYSLPVVYTPHDVLSSTDFSVFKGLNQYPLAMTAHIVYHDIDPDLPATLSPTMIQLIRNEIGFSGLIMSDDIAMKALSGTIAERTKACFDAGCDLVLHCNGKMSEMMEVVEACA
jgi:beta-N-acetylhexosaminidase